MIPKIIFRTIPEHPTPEMEELWARVCDLHGPGYQWQIRTYRDPVDPELFPLTSPVWGLCRSGAQLSGLIRLEALWNHGGFYLDSDMKMFRRLDDLCLREHDVVTAFEDNWITPDAFIAAAPQHPAIMACIALAISRLTGTAPRQYNDWRDDRGAWSTGPGVTTEVFKDRDDVTFLSPGAFYPVFHTPRDTLEQRLHDYEQQLEPGDEPYAIHLYRGSWLAG